jgi:hypothetical protein
MHECDRNLLESILTEKKDLILDNIRNYIVRLLDEL